MTNESTPIRPVTVGPAFHWFGYYDKQQFDVSGRYLLGMEVEFEHRSPRADDRITIGMVDLEDGNRWIALGESCAWCWQQGCMLQWLPGSDTEVIWNDRQGDRFVCHVLDMKTGDKRTLAGPVYTVSPDGRTGFAPDFRRVNEMRPGYGYTGVPDPNSDCLAPADAGIWRLDLESGDYDLIVSIAEIAAIAYPHDDLSMAKHYFNHLLISPDGKRLEFLHRWAKDGQHGIRTRMLTCASDGTDIRIVNDCGYVSHFIWTDPCHILAWSRAGSERGDFCLFDERTGTYEIIGSDMMPQDGHVNCLVASEWLINDTYPDAEHKRALYLYHMPTDRRIDIGRLISPPIYTQEWRCDLHPRLSRDGTKVVIDSVHEGNGRQLYMIDVSELRQR